MRFIAPIILIGISISVFFVFAVPMYGEVGELRARVASYNEALDNSKALENERDKLTAKYNSINPDNLIKLENFLPENIDNIRLILEIEQIALPYGMALRDVKYNTTSEKGAAPVEPGVVQGGGIAAEASRKDYGSWDLEFATLGSYDNFINFTKDLGNNLRIVDIESISFSSGDVAVNPAPGSVISDAYKYNFRVRTYWLKN